MIGLRKIAKDMFEKGLEKTHDGYYFFDTSKYEEKLKMKTKLKSRYPISTAVRPDIFKRLENVRGYGFKIPKLLEMGIKEAEKELNKMS